MISLGICQVRDVLVENMDNWMGPEDMDQELNMRFPNSMRGGLPSTDKWGRVERGVGRRG